ncbi:MAG TPA: hypothetical protein PK339_05385 [Flavitalea sp.]|nr:hypothetical protein [Flavitalea sp.]
MQNDQYPAGSRDEELSFSLPVENEILILKLRAEFGAECSAINPDIPPAVVNEFLTSVYAWERDIFRHAAPVSIYQKIGKPDFPKADGLSDEAVEQALKRLKRLLARHGIRLEMQGDYSCRDLYAFITEELFLFEIDDIDLPQYTHHFCYEDFHPNHELDIRDRAVEFLGDWSRQAINEHDDRLADPFVHPDARNFSKEYVLHKVRRVFTTYRAFQNFHYRIKNIVTDMDDADGSGIGYAEGLVEYDAATASGGVAHFEGPFMLYFFNNGEGWKMFYFIVPGFSWDE